MELPDFMTHANYFSANEFMDKVARVAKRTLGPGMECYIEVYNDITSKTVLKEGQILKIPKLEAKKIKKKTLTKE
jgi:hypothetical protein